MLPWSKWYGFGINVAPQPFFFPCRSQLAAGQMVSLSYVSQVFDLGNIHLYKLDGSVSGGALDLISSQETSTIKIFEITKHIGYGRDITSSSPKNNTVLGVHNWSSSSVLCVSSFVRSPEIFLCLLKLLAPKTCSFPATQFGSFQNLFSKLQCKV